MHSLLADCRAMAINADELPANVMWCYLSASDRNVFSLFVEIPVDQRLFGKPLQTVEP